MAEIVNSPRNIERMAPGNDMVPMTADTDYSSNNIMYLRIGAGSGAISIDTKAGNTRVVNGVTAGDYIWCSVTGWNSSGSDVTEVWGFVA